MVQKAAPGTLFSTTVNYQGCLWDWRSHERRQAQEEGGVAVLMPRI